MVSLSSVWVWCIKALFCNHEMRTLRQIDDQLRTKIGKRYCDDRMKFKEFLSIGRGGCVGYFIFVSSLGFILINARIFWVLEPPDSLSFHLFASACPVICFFKIDIYTLYWTTHACIALHERSRYKFMGQTFGPGFS